MSTLNRIITRTYVARSDRDACLDIWYRASCAAHPFLGADAIADDLPVVRDVYFPNAAVTIAEIDDVIVGFVALLDRHIGGLFVAPDRQRCGVGQVLVGEAARQVGELTVEVYERNQRAAAFYEACGFRRTGRRASDDQGRPHALIAMARPAFAADQTC